MRKYTTFLKIVKSLDDAGLLMKIVRETVGNEVNEQKAGFLGMSVTILGASFLSSIFTGKGVIQAAEGSFRAGHDF